MKLLRSFLLWFLTACVALTSGCGQPASPATIPAMVDRQTKIPANAVKMTPKTDDHPPQVLVSGFAQPIPLPGKVNTAGAEDSPFISANDDTLYFFFTPDVQIPAEKQVIDGVTGLYMSKKVNDQWGDAQRILLQDAGKLALDGCEFVQGDVMWFCSTRENYVGIHWFTAVYKDGKWQNWQNADFPAGYQVGELYISSDGNELYFASGKPGGKGGLDLWLSKKVNGNWQEPVNLAVVNTQDNEGWPAISPDGKELWFTRNFGIWRSKMAGNGWQPAELVVTSLAGEPAFDQSGNLYFVHHFYQNEKMVEADIYVAYKKK